MTHKKLYVTFLLLFLFGLQPQPFHSLQATTPAEQIQKNMLLIIQEVNRLQTERRSILSQLTNSKRYLGSNKQQLDILKKRLKGLNQTIPGLKKQIRLLQKQHYEDIAALKESEKQRKTLTVSREFWKWTAVVSSITAIIAWICWGVK